MKLVKLNKWIMLDVFSVCGSMYSLNAPGAIGYLFTPNKNGRKVNCGMFCNWLTEITSDRWTYYFDYAKKETYRI